MKRDHLIFVVALVALVGYFAWQAGNNSGYGAGTINAQNGAS